MMFDRSGISYFMLMEVDGSTAAVLKEVEIDLWPGFEPLSIRCGLYFE